MPNWNFKDNLTLQTNRFLSVSDYPILGVNTSGNLDIYPPEGGSGIYINSKNSTTASHTFFHTNSLGNVLSNTKLLLGVGENHSTSHLLTLRGGNSIGITNDTSFLKLVSSNFTNGSNLTLFGNNTGQSSGKIVLSANDTGGSLEYFTNSLKRMEILPNGTCNFLPNGSTIVLNINNEETLLTNIVKLSNSSQSTSSTTGALIIEGGIGVKGDTYIDGGLFLNSVTGNINFSSSEISTSYSSGSTYFFGGVGIICSSNAWSQTAGGALSVAGGFALGKDAFIGGKINILSTELSTSSYSGSGIFYGGLGINGQTTIRKDNGNHIALSPQTSLSETSIVFYSSNTYSTTGSWKIGQNIYSSNGSLWISDLLEIQSNNKPHFPQGLYFGNNYNLYGTSSNFYLKNGSTNIVTGDLNGVIYLNSTRDSTSFTNGSMIISGGLGANTIVVNKLINNSGTIGGSLLENNTISNVLITDTQFINSSVLNTTVSNSKITTSTLGSIFISDATVSNFAAFSGTIDDLFSTNTNIENLDTEYFYSNGVMITNGNIGIGTTVPNFSFDNRLVSNLQNLISTNTTIQNLFISQGSILINTTSNNSTVATKSNFLINTFTGTNGNVLSASYLNTSGSTRGFIVHLTDSTKSSNVIFDTNDGYDFRTNTITRMYVSPNGPVGINTTSPEATLDVSGGVKISNSLTVGSIVTSIFSVGSLVTLNQTSSNLYANFSTISNLLINTTLNSNSNTSGTLVVLGGMGIVKDLYVGGTIFTSSDTLLKSDLKPLENTLEKVKNIRPVSFKLKNNPIRNYIGFRAGDFLNDFPEIVSRKNEESYMSISYDRITAINTACIQELILKIESLENKLKNK